MNQFMVIALNSYSYLVAYMGFHGVIKMKAYILSMK